MFCVVQALPWKCILGIIPIFQYLMCIIIENIQLLHKQTNVSVRECMIYFQYIVSGKKISKNIKCVIKIFNYYKFYILYIQVKFCRILRLIWSANKVKVLLQFLCTYWYVRRHKIYFKRLSLQKDRVLTVNEDFKYFQSFSKKILFIRKCFKTVFHIKMNKTE